MGAAATHILFVESNGALMRTISQPHPQLQTIRGFACFLLVVYHSVGADSASGLRLPMNSNWHHMVGIFDFVRMPVFAALAGYVYAFKRVDAASAKRFAISKAKRLMVPLVFATFITTTLRKVAYGANDSFFHALAYPYQQYWFLQSLLVLFVVMAAWDLFRRPNAEVISAIAIVLAVGAKTALPGMFGLVGALYLSPYFLLGIVLHERPGLWLGKGHGAFAAAIVASIMLWRETSSLGWAGCFERSDLIAILCGGAAAVAAFRYLPRTAVFHWLGSFSFPVFLWHSAFGAAARSLIAPLGFSLIESLVVIVVISIICPAALTLLWSALRQRAQQALKASMPRGTLIMDAST